MQTGEENTARKHNTNLTKKCEHKHTQINYGRGLEWESDLDLEFDVFKSIYFKCPFQLNRCHLW